MKLWGPPVTLGARWEHIPCLPQHFSSGCFDFVGAVEEWKGNAFDLSIKRDLAW